MQGFEKTGLGKRVATIFVKWFGKSTLGLAYGLAAAEALLAPAMPSTTARAGGIFMPIINSLSRTAGSMPGKQYPSLGGAPCPSRSLLTCIQESMRPPLLPSHHMLALRLNIVNDLAHALPRFQRCIS